MSLIDEYGAPSTPQPQRKRKSNALTADVEPWAPGAPRTNAVASEWEGGAAAAAAKSNPSYDVWAKPPATQVPAGTANPANNLAPTAMHAPDSRGFLDLKKA